MATNHINLAGEFYAMHCLFRQGYDPALTLGNTKGIDILMYNPKNNKQYKIEVKTSRTTKNEKLFGGKNLNWRMDKKHEELMDSKLTYCFIYLSRDIKLIPRIFFVASEEVAKYVRWEHEYWLQSDHKKPVRDITMRAFRILLNEVDKWENNFAIFD